MSHPRAAALVAAGLLLAALPATPARAESAEVARAAATAAAGRVEALQPEVERALAAYDEALGRLASGISRSISAEQTADEAAAGAAATRARAGDRVRALYMTGSSTALYASVLDATSAADALRRVAYVQALVRAGSATAIDSEQMTRLLRQRADRLDRRGAARVLTAGDVHRRYQAVVGTLEKAAAEYEALSDRARELRQAEDLLARIAELDAAVAASGEQRVASARASDMTARFESLYRKAAKTCRGLSWTVLAAIGQVETGHGANSSSSYAGAQGPMQFMPATFAAYGVDGDGDGDRDVRDPADAVFSAANYLCANGAGRSEQSLPRAIWHYNHAEWYVQLVLKLAAQYAAREMA